MKIQIVVPGLGGLHCDYSVPAAMKIVIAEDQLLCREFLQRLCVSELGLELAGAAGDGVEAMEIIRRTRPELVLLDVQLPGDSGFGIAAKAVREQPRSAAC